MPAPVPTTARDRTRARIVEAAADLVARGGREAVTTRAVAVAAGVQAPTIYRLFGDKDGLLDAVAEHGFETYLARKADRRSSGDVVGDLRAGWDQHVEFGLAHPALYALMFGDPRPGPTSPAAARSWQILRAHVRRAAQAGRLRVGEDQAAHLLHATASGTVLSLLTTPDGERDRSLPDLVRETAIAAISTDAPAIATPGAVGAAVALRAALGEADPLSPGERALLGELLDRVAAAVPARG